MLELTKPRAEELKKLAREHQPCFGSSRARVQNALVEDRLARFTDASLRPVHISLSGDHDWCEITDKGRSALRAYEAEHMSKPKTRTKKAKPKAKPKQAPTLEGLKENPFESRFLEIMEDAIVAAESIDECTMEEFLEGLKAMRVALDDRIACVVSEVEANR